MKKIIQALISRLPERYKWTPHNLVSHPLSEVLYLLGFEELSTQVHDVTIPYGPPTEVITVDLKEVV